MSKRKKQPGTHAPTGRLNLESMSDDQINEAFGRAVEAASPRIQQLIELQEAHIQQLYQGMSEMQQQLFAEGQMFGNALLSDFEHDTVAIELAEADTRRVEHDWSFAEDGKTLTLTVKALPPLEEEEPEAEYVIGVDGGDDVEPEAEYGIYGADGEIIPLPATQPEDGGDDGR